MAEKSRFLERILDPKSPDEAKGFTAERQHTAQAFDLQVEKRDGRWSEGFPWHHYSGRKWTDEGSHERLVIFFSGRAVEILGHNLKPLIDQLREGRLTGVTEMLTSHAVLSRAEGSAETIINNVEMYPDAEEILKEIKGDDGHDTGFVGKMRGR